MCWGLAVGQTQQDLNNLSVWKIHIYIIIFLLKSNPEEAERFCWVTAAEEMPLKANNTLRKVRNFIILSKWF